MDSLNTSLRVLLPYLEELKTPRALSVAILLRYGDYDGILRLPAVDPRHYVDAERYFSDAQATSILRKMGDLPGSDGSARRSAALNKWLDGEYQCYKSNERLSKFIYGGTSTPQDLAIHRFFRRVAKKIESWIGSSPPDLDKIKGRFGPGATFSDRGRLTTVPDKMTSTPTLTRGSAWYILPYLQTAWGRSVSKRRGELSWVRGNRYLTVPKTALIDRSIAVEPAVNLFYQLGLGASIRRRLSINAGWDLDRAQEVHRQIARESSSTQEFATLDLSNASDTVCINLVRLLLPPRWFEELQALRSPSTLVDGKWRVLEKFSSMGNGYTFELETLIFSALASALLEQTGRSGRLGVDCFCFGDDIIIPDDMSRAMVAVLEFCGFSLNKEKSFMGPVPFRESCGGDYFNGLDVRPHFMKRSVNDPWELIPDYNGIRRSLKRLAVFRKVSMGTLYALKDMMPSCVSQCVGPEDLGDVVLHAPEKEWRYKWKHSIRYFRAVIKVAEALPWHHWKPDVVLASALYGVGDGRVGVTPRDGPSSFAVKWVPRS